MWIIVGGDGKRLGRQTGGRGGKKKSRGAGSGWCTRTTWSREGRKYECNIPFSYLSQHIVNILSHVDQCWNLTGNPETGVKEPFCWWFSKNLDYRQIPGMDLLGSLRSGKSSSATHTLGCGPKSSAFGSRASSGSWRAPLISTRPKVEFGRATHHGTPHEYQQQPHGSSI